MSAQTEPVRRNLYPAAFVAALASFCAPISVASDITVQVVVGALGLAAGAFGAVAFAAEHARSKVYSPASVADVVDHDYQAP